MGIVGKYIDALNDERRDRIVEAKNWTDDNRVFVDECGGRCLVGHVEDWYRNGRNFQMPRDRPLVSDRPHNAFPKICRKFGKERIIRACKLRAAKHNKSITVEIDIHELEAVAIEHGG